MDEIICINDHFLEEWEVYFRKNGIKKPIRDKIYTIREIVPNVVGEKGLLLVELVNPPTPRISAAFPNMKGSAEQNWAISRFTTLLGKPITEEMVSEIIRNQQKILK